MMLRKTEGGEEFTGNDRYEGYCKDMMDLIAAKLGVHCKCTMIKYQTISDGNALSD